MFNKLVKDESGIAMGLAVIVVVLVGVMGAGLLVFVRNDLETVVEVNQGQRAMDVAEAGVQAAKQQILGSKTPGHYDLDDGSGCDSGDESPPPEGEDWSPGGDGVSRDFANGQFTVTIQWLNPDSGAPEECRAPETGTPPDGVEYFRVISTGTFGNATRRIEALYNTYPLNVPRAYYTPGPITISGTACIDQVSLFSRSNITFNGNGNCDSGGHIQGNDLYYGNWDRPPFNTTPRTTSAAGVATPGSISGSTDRGTRDFDSGTSPSFIVKDPPDASQSPSEISYPFDVTEQPDANFLCDKARADGNYQLITSSGNAKLQSWPENSNSSTVVCREFASANSSNKLIWDVTGNTNLDDPYEGCRGPIREGTLVVKNGNFTTQSNRALLRGVVVVRGPEGAESDLGTSTDTGNTCLDGFINATGEIKIAGTVRPSTSLEASDRPGFYGAELWSWRELYE